VQLEDPQTVRGPPYQRARQDTGIIGAFGVETTEGPNRLEPSFTLNQATTAVVLSEVGDALAEHLLMGGALASGDCLPV
jgi:hypothetical protein